MRKKAFTDFFKFLNQKGFTVKCDFKPMGGAKGEFYLFQVVGGKNVPVFSNSKAHEKTAVVSFALKADRFADVLEKIQK